MKIVTKYFMYYLVDNNPKKKDAIPTENVYNSMVKA